MAVPADRFAMSPEDAKPLLGIGWTIKIIDRL
jgi:hypothetical protein